jgi:glycosyltransferase involved in cell wall biosynthesis
MDKVYAAADALILPTFYDSFGLVVLEAFSHGLPAISTEFLGASYLIKQSQAGTIVPTPRDTQAMADALKSLPPTDSPEGLALAARAREASQGMLPAEYFDKLLALYEQLRTEK